MTAIILAGGKSSRMGQDKAWLKIGEKAIIEQLLDKLTPIFKEVIISGSRTPDFNKLGVRIIPDELPETGPLGGIYSGLKAIDTDWAFCCACDMPFINPDLINALTCEIDADALICQWEGKIHPLHGFYNKTCLPVIWQALEAEQYRMLDLLPRLRVKYLDETFIAQYDPYGYSFFNLNTPEDLKRATPAAS